MTQPSLFAAPEPPLRKARRKANAGAARALAHAERVRADWQARAVEAVGSYSRLRSQSWLAEDARRYAETCWDVPSAPDSRAWGAVMQACRKAGLIVPCGYAPAVSSNSSPKTLWRKA